MRRLERHLKFQFLGVDCGTERKRNNERVGNKGRIGKMKDMHKDRKTKTEEKLT
jgi:hypothetical protein